MTVEGVGDGRTHKQQLVVDLTDESADPRLVGGKAAPLGRAHAAGHRVPAGFVVTTAARARGLDDIRHELQAELRGLGDGPFAVRSSAVVEDGRVRSFAGQLDTELGVAKGDVAGAIERCWASAKALRALQYAGRDVGAVAVIVQRMVPAEAAGVAFSADPRTGDRGVTVIEAVRGLGDRLVSGGADPETWRVTRRCERVRAVGQPVLDEHTALRVARLARDLQHLFGTPQDVEWALSGGELYLLQSRPITALPAAPVPIPIEVPAGLWERDDHHGVLSPLGWAWFQPYPKAMAEAFKSIGLPIERMETARIGGHLYMRMVMVGGSGKPPPRWVLWLAARLIPALRRANRMAKELLDGETYMGAVDDWERAWRPELQRDIDALYVEDPRRLADDELCKRIDDALALTARGLSYHARAGGPFLFAVGKLVLFVEDHLGWSHDEVFALVTGSSAPTTELHRQIEAIVLSHAGEIAGSELPRTWTALHARHPRLAAALDAWLRENRLRMLHYDPKHAMLGERPDLVLAIATSIAAAPLRSRDTEGTTRAEELLRGADERLEGERATELRRLLAAAKRGYAFRDENGVETVSRPAGLLRHFVLELGRRIEAQIGAREHAVYLYPEEHAPALRGELADIRAIVDRRRGEESWALANRGPQMYGGPKDPMPPVDAFPDALARVFRILAWMERMEGKRCGAGAEGALVGVGIGSRVVTGAARVLAGPEDLVQLRHGEIAVCRITSPEWSVGLGRMAAIVTNEGGMLSHPAIIAREYDVPAVLGTETATRDLTTGDLVRVDPIEGTVAIVRRAISAGA